MSAPTVPLRQSAPAGALHADTICRPLVESRYLYDPLGRRVAKRVGDVNGTWRAGCRCHGNRKWLVRLGRRPADHDTERQEPHPTIYQPGSFTPLIRVETATGDWRKRSAAAWRMRFSSPAAKRWQCGVPAGAGADARPAGKWILADRVSEESRRWLASCGLTWSRCKTRWTRCTRRREKSTLPLRPSRPAAGACQHGRGNRWCAEYDEWGNLLNEENPHQLSSLSGCRGSSMMRSPACITTPPLLWPAAGAVYHSGSDWAKGGWNFYQYPLNPVQYIDSMDWHQNMDT